MKILLLLSLLLGGGAVAGSAVGLYHASKEFEKDDFDEIVAVPPEDQEKTPIYGEAHQTIENLENYRKSIEESIVKKMKV